MRESEKSEFNSLEPAWSRRGPEYKYHAVDDRREEGELLRSPSSVSPGLL